MKRLFTLTAVCGLLGSPVLADDLPATEEGVQVEIQEEAGEESAEVLAVDGEILVDDSQITVEGGEIQGAEGKLKAIEAALKGSGVGLKEETRAAILEALQKTYGDEDMSVESAEGTHGAPKTVKSQLRIQIRTDGEGGQTGDLQKLLKDRLPKLLAEVNPDGDATPLIVDAAAETKVFLFKDGKLVPMNADELKKRKGLPMQFRFPAPAGNPYGKGMHFWNRPGAANGGPASETDQAILKTLKSIDKSLKQINKRLDEMED